MPQTVAQVQQQSYSESINIMTNATLNATAVPLEQQLLKMWQSITGVISVWGQKETKCPPNKV